MATTSNRPAVKTYLVDNLAAALNADGVQVLRTWDGKKLERSTVWIRQTTGTVSFPYAMAGRMARHDDFTVRLVFAAVHPGDTEEEAETRVMDMYAALENLIADDVSADGMDGLTDMTTGTSEGPDTFPNGDQGFGAIVEADVVCKSQLI